MSHCLKCEKIIEVDEHGTVKELHPDCPGCGHEELERQLVEAQARIRDHGLEIVLLKADAQKAKEKFARDEYTIGELVKERDGLLAALMRLSPTLANDPRKRSVEEQIAIVEAEYHSLIQEHADLESACDALRAKLEQAREVVVAWKAFLDIFHDDHGSYRYGWQVAMVTARTIAEKLTLKALAALTAGKEAVPTAWLCTVERPGLACAPGKHHPDCPRVRKEAEG